MENGADEINVEKTPKKWLQKTILDNFSKLSNPHDSVRVKSASGLLKYLNENRETEQGLSEENYAIKRLVRSLGAQSFPHRAGHYAALVGLLKTNNAIDAKTILELVQSELHKSGKNSDAENADIAAGQILACGAIIRSGLYEKTEESLQLELLQLLLNASKERTYLKLFGYTFLIDHLNQIVDKPELVKLINEEISKPWTEQSLDSLYLLFALRQIHPKEYGKKFVKKHLGTPDLFCDDSYEPLSNILMTIPRVTSLKHPIFEVLLQHVTAKDLDGFFNELDKHLKTPNRNRLLVFIKILTNTLRLFTVPEMFTHNFIIQLLGYFRTFKGNQKDKEYHEAVQKLFEILTESLKNDQIQSNIKIELIKKFLFDPGTFVFEKVTKSKIVQQITLGMDVDGVKTLAKVYQGVVDGSERINSENESETWLNNDRLYSAHMLIKLLSMPNMKLENEWKAEKLQFLLSMSLLRNNIGRELSETLKNAFFGALDLKLSKLDELQSILFQLTEYLDANLDNLRNPLNEDSVELWQKTLLIIKKLTKKKKKSSTNSVFLTLFLHMGLQLFNDVKLASESLNELFSCYERVKRDKVEEDSEDPHWLEVVIELFLNLLSHNSHLLRSIINSVFPHLCQYMTSNTIHQILSVLDPKNEENPLSKDDTDDDDDESDEDTAEDEEEDVEEEEDIDEEETVTDKLRMALQQALSNGQSDDESIDLDQMSETEADKLDQALAEAFKQYRPNKGRGRKQTKDQETLTHFRVRVLDLIEIYLDSAPSMLLALETMPPLLQAVEFSIRDEHQKPLNDRLKSVLKKLLNLKKFSTTDNVNGKVLVTLLKSLLDKEGKSALIVQEMGEQISNCCIFVIKCSDLLNKKKVRKQILELLSGELLQFFTKRDCLTPYILFKDLMQVVWQSNLDLAIVLMDFMYNNEIRQYKKNQVAELLKIFYSNQRFFSQFKDETKLSEPLKEFSSKTIEFFKNLCENPQKKGIKERFICNFFNLLTAMKNCPVTQSLAVDWLEIGEHIREYRSHKSFSKDAKMAFNKLCRALKISHVVKMKDQVTKLAPLLSSDHNDDEEEVETTTEQPTKKKKNKKKSPEKLKLKKEAKQMRLESLSKGLNGQNHFDAEMNGDDDEEDVEMVQNGGTKRKSPADESGTIKKKRLIVKN